MQGRHTHVDMECLSLDEKMSRLREDGGKCRFKRELLHLYRSAALRDGLDTVEQFCSWKFVTRKQVLVNPEFTIFSECPTDAEQVAAWAKRVCMDPRRRKLEMQNRLRRKLDKPEITEEQQRVSEVMANPGEFLRNINPSTVQAAIKAMDPEVSVHDGSLKDAEAAPVPDKSAKSRKRAKRKKKKKTGPSKQSDGNPAELTPELPPPVADF